MGGDEHSTIPVFKVTIYIISAKFWEGLVKTNTPVKEFTDFSICDKESLTFKTHNTEKSLKYEDHTLNSVAQYSFNLNLLHSHIFINSLNSSFLSSY